MRAYGIRKDGSLGIFEKDKPVAGPYDAIIKPLAVGLYNPHVYYELYDSSIDDDFVIGHEAVGVIEEVGENVLDFKPGDRVVVPTVTPDWRTLQLQDIGMAQHSGGLLDGWKLAVTEDGALADFFRVRDADMNIAHLSDDVTPEQAVMLSDMGSTGFHAVDLAGVEFGDTVAIIAMGGVGQMAIAAAKLRGAGRIIGIDGRSVLNKTAKEFGATDIINYHEESPVEKILELTNGKGVDKVVIAGGNADSVGDAFEMVKIGGAIGSTNHYLADTISIPNNAWDQGLSHKRLNFGLLPGGRVRMERLLNLVKYRRFDPGKIVSHKYHGLDEMVDVLDLFENKQDEVIRAVMLFD